MSAISSNTASLILRRLAAVHQKTVAAAIGADETLVSRFASGERGLRIEQIGPALEALGLRLVEAGHVTVDAEEFAAVKRLASNYFKGDK